MRTRSFRTALALSFLVLGTAVAPSCKAISAVGIISDPCPQAISGTGATVRTGRQYTDAIKAAEVRDVTRRRRFPRLFELVVRFRTGC